MSLIKFNQAKSRSEDYIISRDPITGDRDIANLDVRKVGPPILSESVEMYANILQVICKNFQV